jgi:hypothetical protein
MYHTIYHCTKFIKSYKSLLANKTFILTLYDLRLQFAPLYKATKIQFNFLPQKIR